MIAERLTLPPSHSRLEKRISTKIQRPVNFLTGRPNLLSTGLTSLGSRMACGLRLPVAFLSSVMADVRTAHPEDNVLGDVGCVIGNSFKVPGNKERIQRLAG